MLGKTMHVVRDAGAIVDGNSPERAFEESAKFVRYERDDTS